MDNSEDTQKINDNQKEDNVFGINGEKVDAGEQAFLIDQYKQVDEVKTLFYNHKPVTTVVLGVDAEGTFFLYDSTNDVRNTVFMLEHAKSGIFNR